MQERRLTPGLLLLSVCIFLLLIPGGPIENRILTDIPFFLALALSLLAIVLVICATFSVFQTRRGGRRALYKAAWEAGGIAAFYLFDLSGIIPSTPPMSVLVKMFDIVGLATAILLIVSIMRDLKRPTPEMEISYGMSRGEMVSLIAFSVYVGAILTFMATVSSVSRNPALYFWYGMR
jgi:hypothetical protein